MAPVPPTAAVVPPVMHVPFTAKHPAVILNPVDAVVVPVVSSVSCPVTPRFVVVAWVLKSVVAVRAVDEAYGNCDAFVVEVAMKYAAVGVLVAMYDVPLKATRPVPMAPAFVPPRATGSTPVKSEVERSSVAEEETAPAVVRRMPFASQFKLRLFEMTSREEEDCPVTAKSVAVACVVRKLLKIPEVAKKEVEVAFVSVVPPAASMSSAVVVASPVDEVATTKSGALWLYPPNIESLANGLVVPIASVPETY